MKEKKKEKKSLIDETIDDLIEYIKSNDLKAGDKLSNEQVLGDELNVGRSTLREAVRALASRNVLEVRHGSGTYISDQTGVGEDPLGFTFISDTYKLTQDLFEVRFLIEPATAMVAAENRSAKQLRELRNIHQQCLDLFEETGQFNIQLDIDFHSLIAEMSGNVAIHHLTPVIIQSISLYNHYYTSDEIILETLHHHGQILEAIAKKDGRGAHSAMLLHLAENRATLSRFKPEDIEQ